jgi:small-conductance mechanosensitive channel
MQLPGSIDQWLYDPVVGKLITAVIGVAVIYALVRFLQRSVNRYVAETETRYRTRKLVTFIGYIAAAGVLATVFSERLTGLTVAFGVAGAGIAFALQEIIASVAGWVAISFGGFYRTGDRVQLGGIRGELPDD